MVLIDIRLSAPHHICTNYLPTAFVSLSYSFISPTIPQLMINKLLSLAAITLMSCGTAQASVVVFGNLGSDGAGAIGSSSGTVLTNTTWRAQGFTIGAGVTDLVLAAVTIGFNVNSLGSADVRLDLYSNNSGAPGSSLFNTTQTLAANTLNLPITFTFDQTLSAATTYWIVAQKTGGAGTVAWRPASPTAAPTTKNASGWTNVGGTTYTSGTWGSTGNGSSNSISITAVPEPSAFVMLSLGAIGLVARRRRTA